MKTQRTLLTLAAFLAAAMLGRAADNAAWDQHCAKCHGADGKGQTRMGAKLDIKDLTDPQVQAKLTDETITKNIKEGVVVDGKKKMPEFASKLSDEEVKSLVAKVRSFAKK